MKKIGRSAREKLGEFTMTNPNSRDINLEMYSAEVTVSEDLTKKRLWLEDNNGGVMDLDIFGKTYAEQLGQNPSMGIRGNGHKIQGGEVSSLTIYADTSDATPGTSTTMKLAHVGVMPLQNGAYLKLAQEILKEGWPKGGFVAPITIE